MINKIICGDCLKVMQKMNANSIDTIITDPSLRNDKGRFIRGHNFCGGEKGWIRKGNIPWNKGKKLEARSEKVKKQISETAKITGLGKWMQVRKFSDKIKKKMSETAKRIGSGERLLHKTGNEHPSWKGGVTPKYHRIRTSIEFKLWREAVFTRDNWTCQKYGIKGGKLHPHHIKNFAQYPEVRFVIDNGITLSNRAHKEFHKKYNFRNNTKEQLREFLGNV